MSAAFRTEQVDLDEIDLLDLDRWGRDGFPHHWFARLREEAPLWRHPGPLPGSQSPTTRSGFWVVSRYADVTALGRCPHVLSSDQDRGGVTGLGPGDELQALFDRIAQSAGVDPASILGDDAKHLLTLDPPEHTSYRKLVNRGFTPRMIARLEGTVRSQVDRLLSDRCDGEPFDFVTDVSMPLPMHVIGDLIGAPEQDHLRVMGWTNEAVTGTDPEYSAGPAAELAAVMQLFQYFGELADSHVPDSDGDLTSILLDADLDGESLSPIRLRIFLILLATAGSETTRTALSHMIWELHRHPDQWARLREDPSLIPLAVEEVLRYSAPVCYFRRNAVTTLELDGATIEPGDLVSLWYPSANRDEMVFSDPDTFDVARDPNPHVTFGGGGPHFCLGASLARLELRVTLEELVSRVERIDVLEEPVRLRSNFLNGIKHLRVKLARRRSFLS